MSIKDFIYQLHQSETTGHALDHLERVEKFALSILETEPTANHELTMVIVLLHEMFDDKLGFDISEDEVRDLLSNHDFETKEIETILYTINHMSYSKNLEKRYPLSLEGQIAQDADRLDAIGALGIARAFYYGGAVGHPLYSNEKARTELSGTDYRQNNTCINHFYEKLFNIKALMNTQKGIELAQEKHAFMVQFVQQFESEVSQTFGEI